MNEATQLMLDFTSSLYLGLRHSSQSLRPWQQLTLGVPAALRTPLDARSLESELARLQGCERVILGTSTLHLFWDLFGMLAGRGQTIYFDQRIYPVARWGAERAVARGTPSASFRHLDCQSLRTLIERNSSSGRRPIVLTDGFCPTCGNSAPLADYLEVTQAADGLLIVDDTQAFGILGYSPDAASPYGKGGGGSLQWTAVGGSRIIVINSLAKGFGVPMAMLAGPSELIEWFETRSETRVHSSPPSVAALRAAQHALDINRTSGDVLRRRVVSLVNYFRTLLAQIGWPVGCGIFPVQSLLLKSVHRATSLFEHLLKHGIRTAPVKSEDARFPARISIILTARHKHSDIDRLIEVLDQACVEHRAERSAEQFSKCQLTPETHARSANRPAG
jgi:8-amino-7-oxononanoate synthase